MHLPQRPFEYTKGQLKKLVNPPSSGSGGRKIHPRRFTHLAPGEERSLPTSYSTPTEPGPTLGPGPGPGPDEERLGNSVISSNGTKVVTFKHRARDDVEFPQFVTSGPAPSPVRRGAARGVEGVGDVLPEMRLDMRDEEDAASRD